MADLAALYDLYADAIAPVGEPPDPDVAEANAFFNKIEAHLWRRASFYLAAEANDPTNDKRFTKWADATVSNSRTMALRALTLSLGSTQAETLTREQILGLSDTQIGTGLNTVIPQMAYATVLRG